MKAETIRRDGLTLFLGAGASMDMGFPSGMKLKCDLAKSLGSPADSKLGKVMLSRYPVDVLKAFSEELNIKANSCLSIDALVAKRLDEDDFVQIARVGVWWTILEYEQKSLSRDFQKFWFSRFLDRYLEGVETGDALFDENSQYLHGLQIHSLNYDRLIEETISRWMRCRFPSWDEKIKDATWLDPRQRQPVRHLHGSLMGGLPLLNSSFGCPHPTDPDEVFAKAQFLRFWSEKSGEARDWPLVNIAAQIRRRLLLLGFGFHDNICSRYRLSAGREVNLRDVLATATGLSAEGRKRATEWMVDAFQVDLNLLPKNMTCADAVELLFS